jgi:phosphohistidine phosphatase
VKLYIMRHGPADDSAASGRDFDRALTKSGRERVQKVVAELVSRDEKPRLIVTSPLLRAKQTAEIVAELCSPDEPLVVRQELSPGGPSHALVREMLAAGKKKVMLVGHEPDVSSLVEELYPLWSGGLDKAMVVGLRVRDGVVAERRFVLEPRELVWT